MTHHIALSSLEQFKEIFFCFLNMFHNLVRVRFRLVKSNYKPENESKLLPRFPT